jgi:hypothetical protein
MCKWLFNTTECIWETGCGAKEKLPRAIYYKYCPYCGKLIDIPSFTYIFSDIFGDKVFLERTRNDYMWWIVISAESEDKTYSLTFPESEKFRFIEFLKNPPSSFDNDVHLTVIKASNEKFFDLAYDDEFKLILNEDMMSKLQSSILNL